MSDTVKIILTGKIRSGFERAEVVATLAKMLKVSDGEADAMLTERETILKRDVPPAIAARHVQILRNIGAKVRVEPMQSPAQAEPALPAMENNPNPTPAADSLPAPGRSSTLQLELVPIAAPEPPSDSAPQPYSGSGPIATHEPISPSHIGRSSLPANASVVTTDTPPMLGLSLAGRIGRLRYLVYGWLGIFLVAFAGALLLTLAGFSVRKFSGAPSGLWLLGAVVLGLVVLWLSIRVTVLRLHDVNLSGKWMLAIWILPGFIAGIIRSPALMAAAAILSWLAFFVLLLWPGSSEENDYGFPPGANTLPIYMGTALVILLAVIGIRGYSQLVQPLAQQMAERNAAHASD
jgi:uncharacterized membrane protein YhaH (DUF805 family)